MAFRTFDVGAGTIQRAAATALPNLVLIAGPNGSGKSTLLYELYQQRIALAEPGTDVTYLGPHRSWRKTQMSLYALSEIRPSLSDYLRAPSVPHWSQMQPQGMQGLVAGAMRDPLGPDEMLSFVKSSILKIDFRLQNRLREIWSTEGHVVAEGRVPDVFAPLSELVRALLPHLEFDSADFSDESDLKVFFRRTDGQRSDRVEIDQLSSGEKAAISLLLPTVERQIGRILDDGTSDDTVIGTTLIDEPETHLHPSLQVLFLDYLQRLSARGEGQFILTTHSPTMIDSMSDEGLFLLAPLEQVPDGNQLVSLSDSSTKLEAMRSLTGATHVLTRCRPIVYVEGERPSEKPISDQRLIEMLVPSASGWVLVAAQGQREVISAATKLRAAIGTMLPGLSVFALVDQDQGQADDPDWAVSWPVAMVENLLLDVSAIWKVLEPHREAINLDSETQVRDALLAIAAGLIDDETRLRMPSLRRRVSAKLTLNGPDDVDTALVRLRTTLEEQCAALASETLRNEWATARQAVDEIVAAGETLGRFRGKSIFDAFFDAHAKHAGYSKRAFAYAVAAAASGGERLTTIVGDAEARINNYVPSELVDVLSEIDGLPDFDLTPTATHTIALVRDSKAAWEAGQDLPARGEDLREGCVALAREVEQHGRPDLARSLRTSVAAVAPRSAVS